MTQTDPQWVRSGWGHSVRTQDEAFRAIMRIVSLAAGRQYVWRGCTNSRYRIRSSLLRSLIIDEAEPLPDEALMRQRELAILREAREWGLAIDMGPLASDLYLLAHLQHHGVPTRLLDVTYNPMTALWFACEGNDGQGGVLFAFDTTSMPIYPTIDPQQRQTYGLQSEPFAWTLRYALRQSALYSKPFLVQPTVPNARMSAQEGLFLGGVTPRTDLAGGIDGLPLVLGSAPGKTKLADLFAEGARKSGRPTSLPFCALVIPAALKKTIRTHLTALNKRRSVMYPDVDGFRDSYWDEYLDLRPTTPVLTAFDDEDAGLV